MPSHTLSHKCVILYLAPDAAEMCAMNPYNSVDTRNGVETTTTSIISLTPKHGSRTAPAPETTDRPTQPQIFIRLRRFFTGIVHGTTRARRCTYARNARLTRALHRVSCSVVCCMLYVYVVCLLFARTRAERVREQIVCDYATTSSSSTDDVDDVDGHAFKYPANRVEHNNNNVMCHVSRISADAMACMVMGLCVC